MARTETHDQPAPRFTWRSLAGLFDEAWQREQRRRRWWLLAIVLLVAAGVFTAVLNGGGGNGSGHPTSAVTALRPHAPGSSSSVRSRFALFSQPPASPQAVRRSLGNEPGLASVLTSKNGATGISHPATHIVHTSEGTVWVVTGSGLVSRALARRRVTNGAAACLIMPSLVAGSDDAGTGARWSSSCGGLMVTNTITGFLDRFDGATATTWYGLVPNSVKRVIVSYASGPKTTVTVVDNTFLVHLHGPMQQCMTRRAAREAVNLSTTAKTLTAYCRN